MATVRVFGISSATCAPITGLIVGDMTITGDIGETKKLLGNPCTTIVETKMTAPYVRRMTITGAYESHTLTQSLLDTAVTLSVTADTGAAETISLAGTCVEWDVKVSKDDWSVASITVEKKGASA